MAGITPRWIEGWELVDKGLNGFELLEYVCNYTLKPHRKDTGDRLESPDVRNTRNIIADLRRQSRDMGLAGAQIAKTRQELNERRGKYSDQAFSNLKRSHAYVIARIERLDEVLSRIEDPYSWKGFSPTNPDEKLKAIKELKGCIYRTSDVLRIPELAGMLQGPGDRGSANLEEKGQQATVEAEPEKTLTQPLGQQINGWKGIARTLDCSIKTAKRYQQKQSLPVHKGPTGRTVHVFTNEIDSWRKKSFHRKASKKRT